MQCYMIHVDKFRPYVCLITHMFPQYCDVEHLTLLHSHRLQRSIAMIILCFNPKVGTFVNNIFQACGICSKKKCKSSKNKVQSFQDSFH